MLRFFLLANVTILLPYKVGKIPLPLRCVKSCFSFLTIKEEWSIIYLRWWQDISFNHMHSCIILLILYIFTNPSARTGYDIRSILKRSLTGLNSEFSFSLTSCLTKAEEPSLPYYLSIAGFIPFPRVLVLCERQSVSSRIWTRVTMSISYDDNYYTTGTC